MYVCAGAGGLASCSLLFTLHFASSKCSLLMGLGKNMIWKIRNNKSYFGSLTNCTKNNITFRWMLCVNKNYIDYQPQCTSIRHQLNTNDADEVILMKV